MVRVAKSGKRPMNEFEEIRKLRVGGHGVISKDDIMDFKIDFGLYNQKLEREMKVIKASKKDSGEHKGKKKCAARKHPKKCARKGRRKAVKRYSNTSRSTKRNSGFA